MRHLERSQARGRKYFYYRAGGRRLARLPHPDDPSFEKAYREAALTHEATAKLKAFNANREVRLFIRIMLNNARGRSRQSGIAFDLRRSDVEQILVAQDFKCAVSGLAFSFGKHESATRRAFTPSIDRINNAMGYTPGNIRIVCTIANYALGQWGDASLLKLAIGIVRTNKDSAKPATAKPCQTVPAKD